jgi:hypothetical protein
MTRYKVTLVVAGNNDSKEHRSGDVVADGMDGALDIVSIWIKRTGTIVYEILIETDTNIIFRHLPK